MKNLDSDAQNSFSFNSLTIKAKVDRREMLCKYITNYDVSQTTF